MDYINQSRERKSFTSSAESNCSAAVRPYPFWKISQKLVTPIVPMGLGGVLRPVRRLRLTDLAVTARHPKPLAIALGIVANADYCFPSAKWTWVEFHRRVPLRWHSRTASAIAPLLR